ncbi:MULTISPECIES: hypothetical protein [unclassified Streptomyces]|uniref:hypothetical protein n=1 Tax=unclassified Streptomyces TaxID=2593676 RepID=UPI0020258E93|nr:MULTISPECIES: hypothetical protein [unclassified Streptomyces]MCX4550593.1 hypothetical protein [Streptomyces sp. NBC_01500]WSC22038.1 hypothetical protein OIE60_21420 [Streptomyces sp. NBC_01766]
MTGRELAASASRYTSRKIRGRGAGDQSWQGRAYDMYHQVPEVRFAASWISNAMSGVRLFAGRRADDGTIEPAPPGHRAHEIVSQIAGGPDGQAKMLGAFGKHLTVPGEGWVIVRPNSEVLSPYSPEDGHDWRVLSVKEVRQQSGKLMAEIDGEDVPIPEGDPEAMDPDGPVAIRVWEPDPERAIEADSPVRSSLELLEELLLLNAAVKAIARSRITGRGLLLIPKGTRFPTAGTQQGEAEDDLIEIFMTIAETAIRDPESAAATVPIILELPADAIAEFKHIKFESEFDELAIKLREEAVRRFATGLEIPAEILLGLGDVNHWGQWALTSEAIRLGIEPKAGTVCYAFTQQWLRPILEAEGDPEWHRWLVWYDTSPLRVRTNRSETALQAHDRGVISDAALRRETGFDESDAPDADEIARRKLNPPDETGDETPEDETPPAPPTLPVDESEAPPETLPASAGPGEGLLAAADGLIWGALTAAGEKLRKTPACPRSERGKARDIASARLHTVLSVEAAQVEQWRLLDGAWSRADEIAGRYGLDTECLTSSLDIYARELIAAGVEHEYRLVPTVLTSCVGAAA